MLALTVFFVLLWSIWKYVSPRLSTEGASAFVLPVTIGLTAAIIISGIILVLTSNHGEGGRIFEGIVFLIMLGGVFYGVASLVISLIFVWLIRSLFREIY